MSNSHTPYGSAICYPYQHKESRYLRGEVWRDVPGFEGAYQVSNLGRVRSLDREVAHSRYGTQFVEGRVLSQNVKRHYNGYTNDHVVILNVVLMLEGRRYEYPVRRLVYAAFREPSLLQDQRRMAVSKDGDGFNNRLRNIRVVTNSEKQQRVMAAQRAPRVLQERDHRTFKPTFALWKPVHRCDEKGKILATYPSVIEAARQCGFQEKGITNAAKGRVKYYRGFRWKYASRKVLSALQARYVKAPRQRKRKPGSGE